MCVSVFVCVLLGREGGTGELWKGRQGKLKKLRKVACKGGKCLKMLLKFFFFWLFGFFFFATDRSGTAKCKHTEHDH